MLTTYDNGLVDFETNRTVILRLRYSNIVNYSIMNFIYKLNTHIDRHFICRFEYIGYIVFKSNFDTISM